MKVKLWINGREEGSEGRDLQFIGGKTLSFKGSGWFLQGRKKRRDYCAINSVSTHARKISERIL